MPIYALGNEDELQTVKALLTFDDGLIGYANATEFEKLYLKLRVMARRIGNRKLPLTPALMAGVLELMISIPMGHYGTISGIKENGPSRHLAPLHNHPGMNMLLSKKPILMLLYFCIVQEVKKGKAWQADSTPWRARPIPNIKDSKLIGKLRDKSGEVAELTDLRAPPPKRPRRGCVRLWRSSNRRAVAQCGAYPACNHERDEFCVAHLCKAAVAAQQNPSASAIFGGSSDEGETTRDPRGANSRTPRHRAWDLRREPELALPPLR
ncbi:hypothetical protein Tsubulata_021030 [Turnera subulata]|uniref:Uncharacterized protein n=1 Tax=Turnera subulata TaxID=218843 RepID=A0A9Q0FYE6_9ROSI|nr:hypothetical protein Tsubulata_021030 [Turnera subulata]